MTITSISPNNTAINVARHANIVVTFDKNVDATSVDSSSISVYANTGKVVDGKSTLIKPNSTSDIDDFVNDSTIVFLRGTVTVVDKTITFSSLLPFNASTKYSVAVASSIMSSETPTPHALGKIYTSSFTTADSDVNVQEITTDITTTSILGRMVTITDSDISIFAPSSFKVIDVTPSNNSLIRSTPTFNIYCSSEIDSSTASSNVLVSYSRLIDDYAPTSLTVSTNYTVGVNGKVLTITMNSNAISSDTILYITLLSTLVDTHGVTLDSTINYSFLIQPSTYYTTARFVKIKAGTLLTAISDLDIALCIWFVSGEADSIFSKKTSIDPVIKNKYVLYGVLESLLLNNYNFGLNDFIKKQLGDFNISISNKTKIALYNRLLDEIHHWKKALSEYLNMSSHNYLTLASGADIGRLWPRMDMYGNYRRAYSNPGLNMAYQNAYGKVVKSWDDTFMPISNSVTVFEEL